MRPGTGDDRVLLYKPRNALIPATFPDDPMEPLMDGTMPLPIDATPYEQRRATIAQLRNLVARLRKFTAWQGEQQQSG